MGNSNPLFVGRPKVFEGQKVTQVLSFDGGGVRGIYPAEFIRRVVETNAYSEFLKRTDVFSGTSTGAIVAVALAMGLLPEEICELYKELSPTIFSKSRNFLRRLAVWPPKYSYSQLKRCLAKKFGTAKLSDCQKPCFVFSVSLATHRVTVFRSHAANFKDLSIVDALMCSCAAPTYFSPGCVDDVLYVDGGLGCNNPSHEIVAILCEEFGTNLERINLTSVGNCGQPSPSSKLAIFLRPRWLWALPVINISMESASHLVHTQCNRLQEIKGMGYLRVDSLEAKRVELDDYSGASDFLPDLAHKQLQDHQVKSWLQEWCK